MKIEVTQEHINKGKRKGWYACPVALAIESAIPGSRVSVGRLTITIYKGQQRATRRTPKAVADFIHQFDWYLKAEPFKFALRSMPILFQGNQS